MLHRPKILTLLSALVFALVGIHSTASAGYYDGKTITVITPAPAGGGVSRTAAVFIKYMPEFLDGNPNIIIKNMPGGGGLKALNYLADKGKADGLTLYWGNPKMLSLLLGFPGVRFSTGKFDYIGSGATTYANLIRTDFPPGIKSASDILKVSDFKIAGQGPSSGLDLFSKLPMDLLGLSYKYIPGYKGQPQFNSAVRAKEVDFITTGGTGYHVFYSDTLVKDGTLIPLFYHSPLTEDGQPIKNEGYPEGTENFINFYENKMGKKLSGAQFEAYKWICTYGTLSMSMVTPKGIDANILSQLRDAHKATVKDPEFKAAYIKQFGDWPSWGSGKEYEIKAENYADLSPEALAVLKKMTAKKK